MKAYLRLMLMFVLLLGPGCGDDGEKPDAEAPEVEVEEESEVEVLEESATGNVIIYVSNQSYEKPTVDITVMVGDKQAVKRDFKVERQHKWVPFRFQLEPGTHLIKARTNQGKATFEGTLEVDAAVPQYWTVLSYWNSDKRPDTPSFTFTVGTRQIGFL